MIDELFDREAVARWLDDREFGTGLPLTVEPLSNGRSNVMFGVKRGDDSWVLRRPRQVAVDRADDLMRREFRLLTALGHTDVPHARAIALCEDTSLLGCVFYLMSHVDGFNPVGALPEPLTDARVPVAEAMVDALAALHNVDWRAVGLTDFGRPEGFHQRQVSRWLAQLDSYAGRDLPDLRRVRTWLDTHAPSDYTPAIMHGDYHILNIIMAPDTPARVAAVVDWETSTIGDPLLDMIGFLEVYNQACPSEQGWPDAQALWQRYGQSTGHETSELGSATNYYVTLYNFRMAVLMEGIYQRSRKDPAKPPAQDVAERVALCIERAQAAAEASGFAR
jgi:aminoglycoside phosphotransferase (APT) family kinase protein